MNGRHYGHILRAAALLVVGFVSFVVVRSLLIPKDFGKLGFYRAGALDDIKAKVPVYGDHETCEVCHGAVVEARQGSRHEKVNCEACHGPLGKHATGDDPVKPVQPDSKVLCLRCHLQMAGKYATMPQVPKTHHATEGACITCHKPHNPKLPPIKAATGKG